MRSSNSQPSMLIFHFSRWLFYKTNRKIGFTYLQDAYLPQMDQTHTLSKLNNYLPSFQCTSLDYKFYNSKSPYYQIIVQIQLCNVIYISIHLETNVNFLPICGTSWANLETNMLKNPDHFVMKIVHSPLKNTKWSYSSAQDTFFSNGH